MHIDHLSHRPSAVAYLADQLKAGTLTLFIGAGGSTSAGLPNWPLLIRRIFDLLGMPSSTVSDSDSADRLQRLADDALQHSGLDKRAFARLVSRALYQGVSLSPSLLTSDLLIALGAMLSGSRRGSVTRVMTLNFDSTLEWYLSLHGLVLRVVPRPWTLEGSEDVRIYHPHGFLPHPDMNMLSSDFVILGASDANLRLGTPGDPWFELMRHTLQTSICLFIGMSFRSLEDRVIAPLLTNVKEHVSVDRPTGFWLSEDSPYGSATSYSDLDERRKAFLRSNVVPIFWHDPAEVPEFLLDICRAAAGPIVMN